LRDDRQVFIQKRIALIEKRKSLLLGARTILIKVSPGDVPERGPADCEF
jgi:hypothetical protein